MTITRVSLGLFVRTMRWVEEESVLRCVWQKANTSKNKLRKSLFSIFDAMLLKLHGTCIKFI